MWILAACLSALFAGLTAVLAKAGVASTNSTVATALRTVVVAAGAWGMAALTGAASGIASIDGTSALFLVLSGLATGASWLCYFAALSRGDVSRVAPIDKLSTVLAIILALVLLVAALACLGMTIVISGLLGLALPIIWEPFVKNWHNGGLYLFVPVNDATAPFMPIPGLLILLAGLLLAPWWVKLHNRFVRWALGPTKRTRMAALSQTRREIRDSSAAELRRIERDLHDGTQARLVAMGMTINTAQAMMRSNPEAAEALLTEAKNASATALGELRDLVRGIHPPVLADRGLGDAVRALAADCAISAEVNIEIPERVGPALESAAYFAVSELLGNVVKHSGANRVDIDLRVENGELRISVTDDGRGGANPETGTGLRGIERRLAAFDGLLAIQSPIGGPTSAHITLPVES